jgi:hypothetical protein
MAMTSSRGSVLGLALLLLAACATSAPQKQLRPALVDVAASDAEPIEVTRGTVTAIGAVGGDTGVRSSWFHFSLDRSGETKVTLRVYDAGEPLSLSLYDGTIVGQEDESSTALATRSADRSIETKLTPGEYYVKVGTSPHGEVAEFDLDVSFQPEPPIIIASQPPPQVPEHIPPRPPPVKVEPRPVPVVVMPKSPPAPPAPPIVLPPPAPEPPHEVLAEPSRATANRLRGGDNLLVPIGANSGLRWQWFEVTMLRKGKLMLDLATNGAPVEVVVTNIDGAQLAKMNVIGSAMHHATYPTGKLYVRVGPSAGDAASRVQIQAKIAIVPTIRQE